MCNFHLIHIVWNLKLYSPTLFRDSLALFIVIAKHTEIGYCLLFSKNGHGDSVGDIIILEIYTSSPTLVSVII
jgi:hypothetical protein